MVRKILSVLVFVFGFSGLLWPAGIWKMPVVGDTGIEPVTPTMSR